MGPLFSHRNARPLSHFEAGSTSALPYMSRLVQTCPVCRLPEVRRSGTTITDRPPPHRSVRARLRIRLLPWLHRTYQCFSTDRRLVVTPKLTRREVVCLLEPEVSEHLRIFGGVFPGKVAYRVSAISKNRPGNQSSRRLLPLGRGSRIWIPDKRCKNHYYDREEDRQVSF